jgi:protein involved in polysaccharide export with SLBB domain
MRLTDLISSAMELKPGADMGYVLIRREDPRTRHISVISASLADALLSPASASNIDLRPRDAVHVFSLAFGRQRVIEPILEELKLQSRVGTPHQEVSVSGFVKAPGRFPLEPGMTITDLIRAGGGLAEEAYTLHAEVARYAVVDDEYRNTEVIDVDLGAVLRGDSSSDLVLEEHDNLRISRVPDWDVMATVQLEGEVTFPGAYRIRKGETLHEVLERAGGMTDDAFPEGAVFLREELRLREQQQIDSLAERLEADLTSLSLQKIDTTGAETMSTGQSLLTQLRSTRAVGRLVIDLERIAETHNFDAVRSIELRDGDRLLVPRVSQAVTVIGQTQQNASHLYQPGLSMQDYIDMSGGLTRRADKKLIYVVRASGAVVADGRSRWLGRGTARDIRPGDTIVVPMDIDRIRPLTLWTNVTQILYQAAIAVAAVNSFGN